jgi:hypothetical protein
MCVQEYKFQGSMCAQQSDWCREGKGNGLRGNVQLLWVVVIAYERKNSSHEYIYYINDDVCSRVRTVRATDDYSHRKSRHNKLQSNSK